MSIHYTVLLFNYLRSWWVMDTVRISVTVSVRVIVSKVLGLANLE